MVLTLRESTWMKSCRFKEERQTTLGSSVFAQLMRRTLLLSISSLVIAGCTVSLSNCENRVQIVKIYEAPTEMPDSVLIGRLSHYGKVFSFRRDKIADGIYNGVRTARMRMNLPIPPSILVAGEFIRIWYPHSQKCVVVVEILGTWSLNASRFAVSIVKRLATAWRTARARFYCTV